jgi:hypothetical protein
MQNKPEEFVPPEKREFMLHEMERLVEVFYWQAFKIGCHPFIEFCGLMGEYVKLATEAHKAGIDFTNATAHSGFPLPMKDYHARYIGEKLGCIYGPALQQPEHRQVFLEMLGLVEPRHEDNRAALHDEEPL